MKTRRIAQVDGAGKVIATVESSIADDATFDPLPANGVDITNHPARAAIANRERILDAGVWRAAPAPPAPAPKLDATATDRELLEAVARRLGLL